ncbi:MAG: hypothetical protein AAF364_20200 [Pseudomonadota bacterium]
MLQPTMRIAERLREKLLANQQTGLKHASIFSAQQSSGESVSGYLTSLREQLPDCEFGEMQMDLLAIQFTIGIENQKTQVPKAFVGKNHTF